MVCQCFLTFFEPQHPCLFDLERDAYNPFFALDHVIFAGITNFRKPFAISSPRLQRHNNQSLFTICVFISWSVVAKPLKSQREREKVELFPLKKKYKWDTCSCNQRVPAHLSDGAKVGKLEPSIGIEGSEASLDWTHSLFKVDFFASCFIPPYLNLSFDKYHPT